MAQSARPPLINSAFASVFMLLCAVVAFQAQAADWKSYYNARYGFSVDYPADLFTKVQNPDNGDGVIFKSADDRIEFRAYGFNNGDELPLKQVRDIILEDSDGRDVTYKRIKNNWIVISGYEAGENGVRDIFYQRLTASKDLTQFSVMEIIYPEDRRDQVDALIKRMSLSLTEPGA